MQWASQFSCEAKGVIDEHDWHGQRLRTMGKGDPQGGRPSKYSPELVEAIAARLATGEPLAVICRDEGMPHPSTVRDWMAAKADVSLAIARAREDGFDAIAVEALKIADECRIGEKVKTDSEGKVVEKQTGDMVERARLQIDTRLKLLAKWDPKRYGDKVDVNLGGQPGSPVVHLIELVSGDS